MKHLQELQTEIEHEMTLALPYMCGNSQVLINECIFKIHPLIVYMFHSQYKH